MDPVVAIIQSGIFILEDTLCHMEWSDYHEQAFICFSESFIF